jgi:hypothetical protein
MSKSNILATIPIPGAYRFLFQPSRYKVSYGGRGAGRSWAFIRALLIKALNDKLLILCCREIQSSIRKSVYTLLTQQIDSLGISDKFDVTHDNIICKETGSEFIFAGLYRNTTALKSIEGVDIVDVEEAETVSDESWNILLPTIRKINSEIWIKFNTRYEDDPTYQRFVKNKLDNAIVKFTTWRDNPWFPDVLKEEMKTDFAFRPREAKNIWDGEPIGAGRKLYADFSEKVHVRDFDFAAIRDKAQCFMAIDPAQKYYPACLWLAQWPNGAGGLTRWIFNEWPGKNDLPDWFHKCRKTILYPGSLADMSREICAHDRNDVGMRVFKRAIDTRFAKGSGSGSFYSGDTQGLVSEFAKRENGGLKFECPWEKAIDMQHSNIVKDLQFNTLLELSSFNEPNLFVAQWCLNTIQSLKNHRLEEDSEKESETYKDYSDALRICYAAMDNVTYKGANGQGQAPAPKVSPLYVGVGSGSMAGSSNGWMGA